ncbi:hypothetical protein M378DRAFT_17295 [Amanita muscaria Koide BX008]|uniref:Uncharacterized protein n=1 Tax=Amanita muscaria (strain Koide BX008) TaxID=946122 RepID=A0A0C2S0N8_AMAMK|nr:hypothetical protein M378DRAFT_17295 [Amanita muscaria Koide BX008]
MQGTTLLRISHDPPQPHSLGARRNTVTQGVVQQQPSITTSHSPPSADAGFCSYMRRPKKAKMHLLDHLPPNEYPGHDDDVLLQTSRVELDENPPRMAPSKDDLMDDHRYPGDREHTSEEYTPRSPMIESFPPQSMASSAVKRIRRWGVQGPDRGVV